MSKFYLCRFRSVCINGRFDEMDILVEAPDNIVRGQLNRIVKQVFSPCLLIQTKEVPSHGLIDNGVYQSQDGLYVENLERSVIGKGELAERISQYSSVKSFINHTQKVTSCELNHFCDIAFDFFYDRG